jgi:lipoprotein
MKTTIKQGLCAAAFLLMVAGCSNVVKPTAVANDSFRGNVADYNNGEALKVSTTILPVVVGKYGDADNKYLIKVTFTKPVTNSVKNAITFNVLTPSGAVDKAPTIGAAVPADITVDGNVARCVVTGKDIYVWMKVTGSAVEAINGQHLNQDGDTKESEADDDDYYKDFTLGTPTGILGVTGYLNNGSANSVYSASTWTLDPTFKKADSDYDSSHQVKDPSLGTLVNRAEIIFNPESKGVTADSITGILKDHLRVEQYVNGEWKEVSATFTYNNAAAAADRKWIAPLTLNSNTQVRYKWIGLRNMPALTTTKQSYKVRYSLDCNEVDIKVDGVTNTNHKATEFALWSTNVLEAKKATGDDRRVDLTLKLQANTFDQSSIFISKTLSNVQVTPKKDTGNAYFTDFIGFDKSGLEKDNFKLMYTAGDYNYAYTPATAYNSEDGVNLEDSVQFKWVRKIDLTGMETKITDFAVYGVEDVASLVLYPKVVSGKVSLRYADPVKIDTTTIANDMKKLIKADLEDEDGQSFQELYAVVLPKVRKADKETEAQTAEKAKRFVKAVIRKELNNVKDPSFAFNTHEAHATAFSLYISPKVKVAGFTGVYQDGANKKDIAVPALGFKESAPSADPYEKTGWVKLTVNN